MSNLTYKFRQITTITVSSFEMWKTVLYHDLCDQITTVTVYRSIIHSFELQFLSSIEEREKNLTKDEEVCE